MSNSKKKIVRNNSAGRPASQRAIFDIGDCEAVDKAARPPAFWEGWGGWLLVALTVVVGVFGIMLTYNAFPDDPMGAVNIAGLEHLRFADGAAAGLYGTLLLGEHSPVDGTPLVEDGHLEYFAVIIDNYGEARPPASIDQASFVIEAPVEGGITRQMAFFLNGLELDKVGPIRSARPYFVEWAEEFGVVLAHVGGSPQALTALEEADGLRSLNEMKRGGYFWRDKKRNAPHNVFTSSDLLQAALDKFDLAQPELDEQRPFKLGGPEGRLVSQPTVERIVIDYSVPTYRVTWVYDEESNAYVRHQGSGRVRTEGGDSIQADNIVVQVTEMRVIDNVGRQEIRTVGEGVALVFRDGLVIKAQWSKEGDERTRFLFLDSDQEIPLNAGTTWLQVVAGDTGVEY